LITYYAQQRDAKAALAAAQAAQTAFPENPQILEILGAAQQGAGENNQALETFTRVAKLLPQNPSPLVRVAGVQAAVKDYDGAIGSLHKAIALQPDLSSAWLGLASVYVTAGRSSDGIVDARKLQKEYPKRAVGFGLEGAIQLGQKKPSEAAVAFREGLSREPIPLLSVLSYQALQIAGKPDQAAALAQRWQKDHPKDVQLRSYLAQQAVLAKDYPVAVQQYRAVLEAEPDNVTVLNNLAWSLNELGDPKALEYAERASILAPNVPTVADTYGWILVQRGDAKRGLDMLREASRLAPQDPEIRLHLAKALLKAGDKAAAKSELEALAVQGDASRARTEAQQMLNGL
jgi:putative PEP-CTERM system TPR-repeat lipoprotein